MPLLWRYLWRSYFEVFLLCSCSFIGVLLVTRFQDIARFATLGGNKWGILFFVLYQIPYLIVYAIPFSCLVATLLLFQRLSDNHELTALRASGLGFRAVAFPLMLSAFFLALVNMTFTAEITPRCRIATKELVFEATTVNPLYILQKDPLTKLKNSYVDLKTLELGKEAKDVVVVSLNRAKERLLLFVAKELKLDEENLSGSQVSLISSVESKDSTGFDHVVIENQSQMSTHASHLSHFMHTTDWLLNIDYLPLRLLRVKEEGENLSDKEKGYSPEEIRTEIFRRTSVGCAPITFTLLGIACGARIGRQRSKKGIVAAMALAALFLLTFLSAKSFRSTSLIPPLLFTLPHVLICGFSFFVLHRLSGGKE